MQITNNVVLCALDSDLAASGALGGDLEQLHLKLLSLLDNPAVAVAAAAQGDASTVKEYLSKHPQDVCVYLLYVIIISCECCLFGVIVS